MHNNYLKLYFSKISSELEKIDENEFKKFVYYVNNLKKKNKIIFVGNGGSASIANHCATDFTKLLKIKSVTFNDPNLITCYANDFGHENWMKEALKAYGDNGDLLCLISSSGKSKNIINCANQAKKMRVKLVTFSGFDHKNPLRKKGNLNFWANSKNYNIIEMTHHIWILSVCDYILKSKI